MEKENIVKSSTAEYLTYVAATGDNEDSIEMRYENEDIWLTQRMMSSIYNVTIATINQHIKKIYDDKELAKSSTIKKFLIVQKEGNRKINRNIVHYNLQMIIAIGFKINNEKAVQFRKWANTIVNSFTIKGWVMDEERLKNGGTILTEKYFEKQLEKIREIRLSERKFYQKITDIYATSLDYDSSSKATNRFFSAVQNKLHYSIHNNTAAELIYNRVDSNKNNMGLVTWEGSPKSKIHKYDVSIAKNYLTNEELDELQRVVSAYLDMAELQAKKHIPMTMEDWEIKLNNFLKVWDKEILNDKGKISAEVAKIHAETEFEKFRIIQDGLYKSDFDELIEKTS